MTPGVELTSRDEASRVADVARRLEERFPHLPPGRVVEVVSASHRELDGAVVRDYVPILVEKRSRELLTQEWSATPAEAGQALQAH